MRPSCGPVWHSRLTIPNSSRKPWDKIQGLLSRIPRLYNFPCDTHDMLCGGPAFHLVVASDVSALRFASAFGFDTSVRRKAAQGDAMSWTDERVELLKKLWQDGLSASQIAAELGGVTRNAVIGKVHRLGLSGRGQPT